MAIGYLGMSITEAGDLLGICPNSTSRKISAAEDFLNDVVAAVGGDSPQNVAAAIEARLRTIAMIAIKNPEKFSAWIAEIISINAKQNAGRQQKWQHQNRQITNANGLAPKRAS